GAASATGYSGAASATGYSGAASATGNMGAAMSCGKYGKVKGVDGTALFLCERDDNWNIIHTWSGIVGKKGVKPDIWYTLTNGKPVEMQS
ncbi:MAG: hypothetical protein GY807_21205, partial [Gammaproteobacteria bacterium]|nr:hypothetical protein [Gammaproteobacteria bacterium]